ncbi:MAG: hypothetical protein ABFS56_27390 [Pseudomonadota bacterium]
MPKINLGLLLKNIKRLLIFAITIRISHATYATAPCVSTPEDLRIALTTAASNGEDDEIKIVQGTYMGHFVANGTDNVFLSL